jgi:tRNA (cmo5U34)-methyltransferase
MKTPDNLTAHRSSDYDSQIRRTIPYYDAFHEETINLVAVYTPDPRLWVDTGGETGTLVDLAYRRFPRTELFLADPAPGMLRVAKEKLKGKDRVTILGPVDSIGLKAPKEVDVITAIQVHHYMKPDDRRACIDNLQRLLRSGGIFVTFENIRPMTGQGVENAKNSWVRFQLEQGSGREAVRSHLERFGVEYFPLTVEEHLEMLRTCGFRAVELLWYSVMQAGFYCIK